MTRDRRGQVLLADYLRAYAATPVLTTLGNLPGGGRLFDVCTKAAGPEPEQLRLLGQEDEGEI